MIKSKNGLTKEESSKAVRKIMKFLDESAYPNHGRGKFIAKAMNISLRSAQYLLSDFRKGIENG